MSNLSKGIIAMVLFYIFNLFIMGFIGRFVFIGDEFIISYNLFTYTGLMTLCGVIVACTFKVIEKVDEVKNMLNKLEGKKENQK